MTASATYPSLGLESSPNSSPYTPSSDDLFADINWPEEEPDTPSDQGLCMSCENSPPKDGQRGSQVSRIEIQRTDSPCVDEPVLPACPAAENVTKPAGGCRFSKEARRILRTWFSEHRENPYPTAEEKEELAAKANLKSSQVSLWLVNTRRRYRSRKQQETRAAAIPQTMLPPSRPNPSQAGTIVTEISGHPELNRPFEELNPMDRWKVTAIEQEPAALPVILGNVAVFPPLNFDPYDVSVRHRLQPPSQNGQSDQQLPAVFSPFESNWGPSMAGYDSGLASMVTASTLSDSTCYSYPMNHMAHLGNGGTRDRRRRRGHSSKAPTSASKDRPFQCTFCTDCAFTTKHDWQRHEKSQHLTLESWTCCLSGGIMDTEDGPVCTFCGLINPDTCHMETHNFSACQDRDVQERTFYRKDHFQQHLRLTHDIKFDSRMNLWASAVPMVRSRCGFCSATFTTWSARTDHLAAHFKCHANMKDWVGNWGLEPHIAALVERVRGKTPRLNPQFTESCMPPPSLPYSKPLHSGFVDYMPPLPQQNIEIDWFNGMAGMGSGIGPPDISGALGLEGVEVTDWVDFAI